MKVLPPGGEEKFLSTQKTNKTCIYVGGASEIYGLPFMLAAFRLLNQNKCQYRLILVGRENELKRYHEEIMNTPGVEVYHASGKELQPLYAQADIGLLALQPNEYTNLAVGTKLFQYLSYGLPVISTDVKAMNELISENMFGITTRCDPNEFGSAIRYMLDNPNVLEKYRKSASESLSKKHLWVHRVDQICNDLGMT